MAPEISPVRVRRGSGLSTTAAPAVAGGRRSRYGAEWWLGKHHC